MVTRVIKEEFDITLHSTWARIGCQPLIHVTGARKSIKIFGRVELYSARFLYKRSKVFDAKTYINYLERLARYYYPRRVYHIQDNASYHKDKNVWAWFKENRTWWTVYNLPHRYFIDEQELLSTLTSVFRSIRRNPDQIRGYLNSFL